MTIKTLKSVSPLNHTVAVVQRGFGRFLLYALLIGIGLVLFTPFILAFLGTFKTDAEIIAWPPTFLPAEWLVENWKRATRVGKTSRVMKQARVLPG